jgi:hypothetical protein
VATGLAAAGHADPRFWAALEAVSERRLLSFSGSQLAQIMVALGEWGGVWLRLHPACELQECRQKLCYAVKVFWAQDVLNVALNEICMHIGNRHSKASHQVKFKRLVP